MRPPLFEVTVPAANAAARRLTTAANVNALLGQDAATDDAILSPIIDRVSASAVRYAKLAAAAGTLPTFGAETCRATFFADSSCSDRGSEYLALPRGEIVSAVSSVVENGITLAAGTDYVMLAGGILQRLNSSTGAPRKWSAAKIVVVFTTGWTLPAGVPPDLEGAIIDQVKMAYLGRDSDNRIRTETINDVEQVEYAVAGGTSIGRSGLLVSLEDALDPYTDKAQG